MTVDLSDKKIIFRCKSKVSKSGKKQYHFNVPNAPFRSQIINPDKKYLIYYVEESPQQNELITNDIGELQTFKPLLETKIPFYSNVAHPSGQYRINIPKDVIKNKLIDPIKQVEYWIYFVIKK